MRDDGEISTVVPKLKQHKKKRSVKNWFLRIFRIKRSKAPSRFTVDSQKNVSSSSQSITSEENTEDVVIECNDIQSQDVLSEQDDHESLIEENGMSLNRTSFDERYISPHDNVINPYVVSHHPSHYVDDKTMDILHIQPTNIHCFGTSTGYCRMQTRYISCIL